MLNHYRYYYYNIYGGKFNIYKTRQDVPINRFISSLKSGNLARIILRAYNDKYVTTVNGGGGFVIANQDNITPESNLLFVPQGLQRERVIIRTSGGYFVSTSGVGENFLSARNTFIDQNSSFEIIPLYPDKIALKNNQGYYLSVLENNLISGDWISIMPEGIFTIIEVQDET